MGSIGPTRGRCLSKLREALERMQQVVNASLAHLLERLDALIVGPVRESLDTTRYQEARSDSARGACGDAAVAVADARRPGAHVAAVSDAVSRAARAATVTAVRGSRGRAGGARAEEDVTDAAAGWAASTVRVGAAATSEAVAQVAKRVDLLHVSAHGRHSAANPLLSGVLLADGPWFGEDVDQLPAIPAVMLLSACEVGRSAVRWGQEALCMSQTWIHAGVRCVIAAPASVNDSLACELLTEAHSFIAAGVAPAEALATAGTASGRRPALQCHGAG